MIDPDANAVEEWREPGTMMHPVGSASFDSSESFMVVHLVDGTYELFRHFYGQRRFNNGQDKPFGAVAGVLNRWCRPRRRGH